MYWYKQLFLKCINPFLGDNICPTLDDKLKSLGALRFVIQSILKVSWLLDIQQALIILSLSEDLIKHAHAR